MSVNHLIELGRIADREIGKRDAELAALRAQLEEAKAERDEAISEKFVDNLMNELDQAKAALAASELARKELRDFAQSAQDIDITGEAIEDMQRRAQILLSKPHSTTALEECVQKRTK